MQYPEYRPRRLRRRESLRRLIRETQVLIDNLVCPLFVKEGKNLCEPIASMPGQHRWSVDRLGAEAKEIAKLGIPAVILFGIPAQKDETGSEAVRPDGVVPRAVRAIREAAPDLAIITDVCIDEYTSHGHCGVLQDGEVDNDATLEVLGEMALAHAKAGADIVAPSDMMDGRVGAIRDSLDRKGHSGVGILSYAVKYASAYYGPFRDAAFSAPGKGDRRGYQMDPRNAREAEREALLDEQEGADALMVKPALAYLDVIRRVRQATRLPLAAYNVSGEYSMVKAAAARGWCSERDIVRENLNAIVRAGADLVITYHARDALRGDWL